jgi:two-component system sensor histidine kinase AgrC
MLDVCQILGVYLDNAIEEVKKLDIKNIFVEMYQHNGKMILAVSNNFTGTINLNKINEIGYTTKSDGHGYGLTLTQNIIEKNNKLSGETSIINDVFIQNLKIEM